jgi:hypothetical protein
MANVTHLSQNGKGVRAGRRRRLSQTIPPLDPAQHLPAPPGPTLAQVGEHILQLTSRLMVHLEDLDRLHQLTVQLQQQELSVCLEVRDAGLLEPTVAGLAQDVHDRWGALLSELAIVLTWLAEEHEATPSGA